MLTHCYPNMFPIIVDFPIKNRDFPWFLVCFPILTVTNHMFLSPRSPLRPLPPWASRWCIQWPADNAGAVFATGAVWRWWHSKGLNDGTSRYVQYIIIYIHIMLYTYIYIRIYSDIYIYTLLHTYIYIYVILLDLTWFNHHPRTLVFAQRMVGDENAIRTARTAQTLPERRDGPPSYSWWMDGDSTKKNMVTLW